jgi:murein DD-endopeptidase MepM/ murein hydrolase activator NlpD
VAREARHALIHRRLASSRSRREGVAARAVVGLVAIIACSGHRPSKPETQPVPPTAASDRTIDEPTYLRIRMLMVPVSGVRPDQLRDSYLESRSGGRTHRALDIPARRGTPVVSADDGRVLRLRRNTLGGITIYAVDAGDRFVYYYAHLERYAPSLAEGETVAKGQVIGYVGTTGNAPPNLPHLHFQLMRRPNAARWWDGEPLNPKPYLVLAGKAKDRG